MMILIEKDKAIKKTWEEPSYSDPLNVLTEIRDRLNALPTIEIVRCEDCEHKDAETGFCKGRGWPMQLVPNDGFCDKGERRTDE